MRHRGRGTRPGERAPVSSEHHNHPSVAILKGAGPTPLTDELQADLDVWIAEYNELRPHQGAWCFGKTLMQTFLDALPLAKEKLMAA